MPGSAVVIVAGGRGTRFSGSVPKQYADLLGRPVLRWAVEPFLAHPRIDTVLVVISPETRALYREATVGLALPDPVYGGATRQGSVLNGLEALAPAGPDTVLIHDAARPLTPPTVIDRVLDALAGGDAAVPVLPLSDTVKQCSESGRITATLPREGLWRAQTPQGFRFERILTAARAAGETGATFTDDASIAEWHGMTVDTVPGAETALKITTTGDLHMAEMLARAGSETRVGYGYDVHRFGPGDHVMLCGQRIPHDRGLIGHSDADAGLHAITDALLGAIGDGDIGQHFPPSDPRWKGADSSGFLADAAARVHNRGGRIVHVDVTIVCEAPKVAPYREAMARTLSKILGIDVGRISIKATTTEGLGFTGRAEGLAAQCVASVALPGPGLRGASS